MNKFFKLIRIILQIFFLYILVFTSSSVSLEKYYRGDTISNYFSGVISLQNNDYEDSYNFFKKLNNLEDNHYKFSKSYLETLVNNSKINEAFKYSKKLEIKKKNFFQSDIVIISKFIKNNNFSKASDYLNLTIKNNYTPLQELLSQIIFSWVSVEKSKLNYDDAKQVFKLISPKYKNIKKINDVFLNCYFDTSNVNEKFLRLTNDQTTDFSRYTFFYANYLFKKDHNYEINLLFSDNAFITLTAETLDVVLEDQKNTYD